MGHSMEYYLSKGLDEKMAKYFAEGRQRIEAVSPNPDFTLTIFFDNGDKRLLDMRPFLQPNTVFAPFIKWEDFSRVYVDDTHSIAWDIDPNVNSNIVWNNKVDLCPDVCYVDSIPCP